MERKSLSRNRVSDLHVCWLIIYFWNRLDGAWWVTYIGYESEKDFKDEKWDSGSNSFENSVSQKHVFIRIISIKIHWYRLFSIYLFNVSIKVDVEVINILDLVVDMQTG